MPEADFTNVDPNDAIDALQRRTDILQPTNSWWEMWQAQHSAAFTVARSAGFDILSDISSALDDALKQGTTYEDFIKRIVPILQEKGWWGRDLGSLRRLKLIFDTNMRTSYMAGRWASIQRNKEERPYLRYMHTTSEHPRPLHLLWNGITLPCDHPLWDTHYPPNGWGCKCSVITLSRRQYDAASEAGTILTEAPKIDWRTVVNKLTGEIFRVPDGIDPGWGYNVGQAFLKALGPGG